MSQPLENPETLSPVKRALLEIRELRARLAEVEDARTEPLAVIGIGCRLPGAYGPEAFFRMLLAGTDAIREVPGDRWDANAYYDANPDTPGCMDSRWGGFLDDIDLFDAPLFGISPREAVAVDPQQRILLEVAWEALEHAGQAPDRQSGTRTGVFIGIGTSDYAQLQLKQRSISTIDGHYATGSLSHSVASGRLAYVFGFQGPALSVDTACSSSLVALHLACQSLRLGECRMAIAGGVNLILSPENSISLSKSHMFAADGRCKTFDAAADGFVRGEGCALVVLKKLSDARADGDRILALVRGSALNQDGKSNGLTAPNGPSQEAVLREAVANARLEPHQVGYVETHGTGTELGDPIELQALAAALGKGRTAEHPLVVGSVKTNIGHLEATAGVAGFIKLVLALQHRYIPPHLHFKNPNPHVAWNEMPIRVASQGLPWEPIGGRRIGGVSSFGFSGTNAHIILEEAPVASQPESAERAWHLLCCSARTDDALGATATRWSEHLERADAPAVADLCYTALTGRAHLASRAAAVVDSAASARNALEQIAEGAKAAPLRRGKVSGSERPRIAFLFTGQGAQYANMGRQLYESEPIFREAVDRCEATLAGLGAPIRSILYPPDPSSVSDRLHQTRWTQPALFVVAYALTQLWRSYGVEPDAVMGHSVGEYAAAVAAGILDLESALRLVTARAALMQESSGAGAMAAIFAPERDVAALLRARTGELSIAAVNAPGNTVVSGERTALENLVAVAEGRNIRCHWLRVSHGFHSPLMEPVLARYRDAAGQIRASRGRIPLVSNLTGTWMETPGAGYWARHLRETVRFADGMRILLDSGYEIFLEAGPGSTLLTLGQQSAVGKRALWVPSLREGRDESRQILESAADLYVNGIAINGAALYSGQARRKVALPTYAFDRKRYWFEADLRSDTARPSAPPALPVESPKQRPITDAVRAAFPDQRRAMLLQFTGDHVKSVLGLDPSEPLDPRQGLTALGLDSLMSVELRTRVESGFALSKPLPATLVFDYPTLDAIVNVLTRDLLAHTEPAATPVTSSPRLLDEAQVDALSEDEAEALLMLRLEALQ